MRTILPSILLAGLAAAMPNAGAAGHSSSHATADYRWRENGRGLDLHSQTGRGVTVTRVTPEPFHGLRRGDVLLTADGAPLDDVGDFARSLQGRTTPLPLTVRRGNKVIALVLPLDGAGASPPPPPRP